MITGINVSKTLTKHISCKLCKSMVYHANVNAILMEENVIKINGGVTITLDVSVKNVMYVKKIIFGILQHVVVKLENI